MSLGQKKRELLDKDLLLSDRKLIIFISGFELGTEQENLSLELFCKMIRGESGGVEEMKMMS